MNIIEKIRNYTNTFGDAKDLSDGFHISVYEKCIHIRDYDDETDSDDDSERNDCVLDVHISKDGSITHQRFIKLYGQTLEDLQEEFPCAKDSEHYLYLGNSSNLEMEIKEGEDEDGEIDYDVEWQYRFKTKTISNEELREQLLLCNSIRYFLENTCSVKSAVQLE